MLEVLAGALILACGWRLYRLYLPTRYIALNNEGHPQYFGAVMGGAYLAFLGVSVHTAVSGSPFYQWLQIVLAPLMPSAEPMPAHTVELASIVAWGVALSWLLPPLLNAPLIFIKGVSRSVREQQSVDELDQAIRYSVGRGLSLAVTLSSGKVYVGISLREEDEDGDQSWLVMLPLASGFRDAKGQLELTTAYQPVYLKQADRPPEDFLVLLPMSQISSVQTFDLEFYQSGAFEDADYEPEAAAETGPSAAVVEKPETPDEEVESEEPAPEAKEPFRVDMSAYQRVYSTLLSAAVATLPLGWRVALIFLGGAGLTVTAMAIAEPKDS